MNRREILKSSLAIIPILAGVSLNAQETSMEAKKENPFFEYFKNKHGFELYPYQKKYIDFLENSSEKLIIVRKPRQIGFSTLHYTWVEYRNVNFGEISVITNFTKSGCWYSGSAESEKNNYIMDEFGSVYGLRSVAVYLDRILNGKEIKFNKLILLSTPGRIYYKKSNKDGRTINHCAKIFKDLYYKFPKSVFNITHEDLKVCKEWNRVVEMSKKHQWNRSNYEMEVLGKFPVEFI